jgi:hypothetical protein
MRAETRAWQFWRASWVSKTIISSRRLPIGGVQQWKMNCEASRDRCHCSNQEYSCCRLKGSTLPPLYLLTLNSPLVCFLPPVVRPDCSSSFLKSLLQVLGSRSQKLPGHWRWEFSDSTFVVLPTRRCLIASLCVSAYLDVSFPSRRVLQEEVWYHIAQTTRRSIPRLQGSDSYSRCGRPTRDSAQISTANRGPSLSVFPQSQSTKSKFAKSTLPIFFTTVPTHQFGANTDPRPGDQLLLPSISLPFDRKPCYPCWRGMKQSIGR